jgi:hypothetical protein
MQGQQNNFNRNILPGIRTEAGQAGQIGGTRHGIAEGIAAGDLMNQERLARENIYGNAFAQQQAGQQQAVSDVLRAQQGDQQAALEAGGLTNQAYQNYIGNLLTGTGQVQDALGTGEKLGLDAAGTATAQAGSIFGQGNNAQLQQTLGAMGMLPTFQASSLSNLGAMNNMGLQQYGLEQTGMDALANQYYYNQNSPFNLLSQYQQYIAGPWGSTINSQAGYGGGNIFDGGGGGGVPNIPSWPWNIGGNNPFGNWGTPNTGSNNNPGGYSANNPWPPASPTNPGATPYPWFPGNQPPISGGNSGVFNSLNPFTPLNSGTRQPGNGFLGRLSEHVRNPNNRLGGASGGIVPGGQNLGSGVPNTPRTINPPQAGAQQGTGGINFTRRQQPGQPTQGFKIPEFKGFGGNLNFGF